MLKMNLIMHKETYISEIAVNGILIQTINAHIHCKQCMPTHIGLISIFRFCIQSVFYSQHIFGLGIFRFHYCSCNDVNSKLLTVWFYFDYMIYCMTYSVSYQHLILVWVIDMNHAEEYVLGWIKFDHWWL